MTCWDCKYHKPVSVAFSFCKLKKRGISCADIPKGCPSFRPGTKKTANKALILKDVCQQLRAIRSNLDSMMTGLCQLSLSNIAEELNDDIAKELDEVLDKLKDIQEPDK